jgi:hypothetical protein
MHPRLQDLKLDLKQSKSRPRRRSPEFLNSCNQSASEDRASRNRKSDFQLVIVIGNQPINPTRTNSRMAPHEAQERLSLIQHMAYNVKYLEGADCWLR